MIGQLTNYLFGPAIHRAAIRGDLSKLKKIIAAGGDLNLSDRSGITPLMIAAQKGHKEIVEYLIDHGADINAKTKGGFSALFNPCIQGNIDVASLLIAHGADVNVISNDAPLLSYVALRGDKKMVELLLSHGADPYATDDVGFTALVATKFRKRRDIALLIESYMKKEKTT